MSEEVSVGMVDVQSFTILDITIYKLNIRISAYSFSHPVAYLCHF
jgi:hypothetical protein